MGYYLQVPMPHGKALELAAKHGGELVSKEQAAEAMNDPTKGVVVVVDNGPFEAAGFAFDQGEWEAFNLPGDKRPRKFVVLDRETAERESGFPRGGA